MWALGTFDYEPRWLNMASFAGLEALGGVPCWRREPEEVRIRQKCTIFLVQ